jgi:hypothetical protein
MVFEMRLSKSHYNKETDKIYAESELDYWHEKHHQYINKETNFNLLQEIAFFLLIFAMMFSNFQWKLGTFIFFFGLEIIEEISCWIYAYKIMGNKK